MSTIATLARHDAERMLPILKLARTMPVPPVPPLFAVPLPPLEPLVPPELLQLCRAFEAAHAPIIAVWEKLKPFYFGA